MPQERDNHGDAVELKGNVTFTKRHEKKLMELDRAVYGDPENQVSGLLHRIDEKKLGDLDRAVYGDPANQAPGLLRRVEVIEGWWKKVFWLVVSPSVVAALVTFLLNFIVGLF